MIQNMTIDGVNVLRDLGIFIKTRSIQLPEMKTFFVDVPGADGVLDLSTALTGGDMKFEDREVTIEFTTPGSYVGARDDLARLVHGRSVEFSFQDDPDFYFIARRARIDEWEYDEDGVPTFTVVFQAHPYRYRRELTRVEFTVDGSPLIIENSRMWTRATFTASRDMSVFFGGAKWQLPGGEPRVIRDLVLREGKNSLLFTGAGSVVVEYQEGEL